MAEREILLSPADNSDAVAVAPKLFRKRILPMATINYMGRKITFDRAYLTELASNFNDGAYDQVAFMLADSKNTHTLDPERFRGEIKSVEVLDDGLWGTVAVTDSAAEMLKENPKLGVSARILENYQRSDGKVYGRALQHVLGTLDPRIPGLGSWEEVALSNGGDDTVIDLSATSYEELERMATREENIAAVAEAVGISVEEVEALAFSDDALAEYADTFRAAEAETAEAAAEETETEAAAEVEEEELFSDLSDEELAALVAELEAEEESTEAVAEEETSEEATAEVETETEAEAEVAAEETSEEAVAETEEEAELDGELSDADFARFMAEGNFGQGLGDDTNADADVADDELSDAEIAAFLDRPFAEWNMDSASEETEEVAEEEPVVAALSNEVEEEAAPAVELSNEETSALELANRRIRELEGANRLARFESVKKDYVRKGVPAHLLDLARPILTADSSAVELSNGGETVDAAAVLREILDQVTGYIDLAAERGHSYPLSDANPAELAAEEDKALARLWAEEAGR